MRASVFIKLFYVFEFFFDLIFIYAVEKLFFLSRGISLSQIGLLLFFWSAMTLVFEVPTGILADHWSRRKMLILSGIFFSIAYFTWIFANSFLIFLFGFVFRTLGGAFASGTLQAYVYDFLKLNHRENEFEKIWGRGNAFRTLGLGVAALLGGIFSQISYVFTLSASSISVLTVSLIAFLWPEVPVFTSTREVNYWHFFKDSLQTVWKNIYLLRIVIYTVTVFSVFGAIEEYNDVYLKFLGYPNYIIGLIFALATVGQTIASLVAHKFKNYSWITLNIIAVIGVGILFLASLVKHPLMVVAILFLGIMLEFSRILNEGVIQREANPTQRATVASLNSFVNDLIPLGLIFGLIADNFKLQYSYAFMGLFTLTYFIFLLFLKPKQHE